jgi:site-specific DNA recombinase
MLRNWVYLGEINHRDKSYPGEHQPLIEQALFDQVRAKLDENLRGRRLHSQRSDALLLGKLFSDRGNRMTSSYAIKKVVRYRYYVSCVLAQGRKEEAGSISRLAADAVETIVLEALAAQKPLGGGQERKDQLSQTLVAEQQRPESLSDKERVKRFVQRTIIGGQSIEVRLIEGAGLAARSNAITIPWSLKTFRRKREVIQPTDGSAGGARPIRVEARTNHLVAIAKGGAGSTTSCPARPSMSK